MTSRVVKLEIETADDDMLIVDLEVSGTYGDLGIGSYEYWGFKGRDVRMGWEIEGWDYDESLYTKEQNKMIEEYIQKNEDYICNKFFKMAEDD